MAAAKKKRAKSYAAVVAVAGAGTVTKKQAKTHLSDFIESVDGEILWVLPIGADVTKSLTTVFDFLWAEEARYVLVTDEEGADEDWVDNAESVVEAEDVYSAAVETVTEHDTEDKRVIFLLDEEHEGDLALLESAMNADLKCLDLGAGLAELDVEDSEEDAEEVAEEDAADEPDDEVVEEAAAEEDDDVIEEVEVKLPPKTKKLLDKGDAEGAALKLAEELGSAEVRKIADQVGVTYGKGVWAKTIAKDIIDTLISGEAPEAEAVEETAPEPEAAPEEAPKAKPRKRTPKAEKASEPVEVTEEEADAVAEGSSVVQGRSSLGDHIELLQAVTHVAAQRGAAEAEQFIEILRKYGLVV